jgi:hypothetical protein
MADLRADRKVKTASFTVRTALEVTEDGIAADRDGNP